MMLERKTFLSRNTIAVIWLLLASIMFTRCTLPEEGSIEGTIQSDLGTAVMTTTPSTQVQGFVATPYSTPTRRPTATSISLTRAAMDHVFGHLLYWSETGISKIELGTAERIQLVAVDNPEIIRDTILSPDQRWLAYWEVLPSGSFIQLVDIEAGSVRPLHNFGSLDTRTPYLFWSPDSLFLFITLESAAALPVMGEPTPDPVVRRTHYLISLESSEVQPWPWDCDRIGLSPRTNEIALWCPAAENLEESYAVIEWGGDIWFTAAAPTTVLKIRAPEFQYPTWAWSGDGKKVVFPDKDQQRPQILIEASTHSGELITRTIGDYGIAYSGLSWSADGRYIAFRGQCATSAPCLQVISANSGDIIWSSESLGEANRALHRHMWHSRENLILLPSSTDGRYRVFIIDPIADTLIYEQDLEGGSRFGIGWLP
jgi:hypothetical protein